MQCTHPEAANTAALSSELESLWDDDAHPTLPPCIVVAHIQPQNTQVEHSVPLVLSQPPERPLTVGETAILHPEVELEGQSQDCDLSDNNLRNLGKDQSSFFEINFHFCGNGVKHLVQHHMELRHDLASPQISDKANLGRVFL